MRVAGSIALRPSRRLALILLTLHLVAALAPWAVRLPVWADLLIEAGVLLSAWQAWRRWSWPRGHCLHLAEEGGLALSRGEAAPAWVDLSPESRDMGVLIVLRWCELTTSQHGAVCLTQDSLVNAEDWRRLKIWLRWRAAQPINASA